MTLYTDAIAPLLSGARWGVGDAPGTAERVTYTFMTSLPSYVPAGSQQAKAFKAFTAAQKTAVRNILDDIQSFTNLTFTEKAQTGPGVSNVGMIGFWNVDLSSISGVANYPGLTTSGLVGDVTMNHLSSTILNPTPGSKGYMYLAHEIGHALGLKHPGDYNSNSSGTSGPYLPEAQDNLHYTMMSYTGDALLNGLSPSSYRLFDVASLQYLYGANMSYATGDNAYKFGGLSNVSKVIWDAGGTDTLDATGDTRGVKLDLHEGAFSSAGLMNGKVAVDNIAIAFGAKIENATGGSGNDTLTGNALDNILLGGAGDDTLSGGGGADRLDGGTGTDVAILDRTRASYSVKAVTGGVVLTDAQGVRTTALNIESFRFADATASLSDLLGKAAGGPAAPPAPTPELNLIEGRDVADRLAGTAGADLFVGKGGNDFLVSSADQAPDVFLFGPGDGHDRIFGFEPGIDRIDLSGFGLSGFDDPRLRVVVDGTGLGVRVDGQRILIDGGAALSSLDPADLITLDGGGHSAATAAGTLAIGASGVAWTAAGPDLSFLRAADGRSF